MELNKEQIEYAEKNMIKWLSHPNELGNEPTKIEFLDIVTVPRRDNVYYLFKFKSDNKLHKNKGWMLGLGGGYAKTDIPTASWEEQPFSEFECLEKDYKMQATRIINMLIDYWITRSKQILSKLDENK